MYNNLLFGVKRRILSEVEDAFLNDPAFAEKVKITNKFPYSDRIQMGVVLRNSAASQIRMSADNYLADLYSHVRLARVENYPGVSIEWVRENTNDITKYIVDENLSLQVDPTQRLYTTALKIVCGNGDTTYSYDPQSVVVTVNGSPVSVESVDGLRQQIILRTPVAAGSVLKISYWYRAMVEPGIYTVNFVANNQFIVDIVYIINDEVLVENTTGLEVSETSHYPNIFPDSEEINLKTRGTHTNHTTTNRLYGDTGTDIILVKGTDYTIDYTTGVITFLHPIDSGYQLTVSYRYSDGISVGPIDFEPYQESHVLGGVTLCIGRRAQQGDKQVIIVSENREPQASIYGGHWDMSLSLGVIAKDTIQMEEMVDQIVNYLWGIRKNVLEFEGITLNRVEPTGESEESFIETTGDLYFESSIDISVMSEWQRFIPHLYSIRHIFSDMVIVPDVRPVLKAPTIGFERVRTV